MNKPTPTPALETAMSIAAPAVIATIEACQDCTFARENGELDTKPDREPWNMLPTAEVALDYRGDEPVINEFRWTPCGACGSMLAGTRYVYAVFAWERPTTIGYNHDSSGEYVITFDAEALTLTTTLDGLPYITESLEVSNDFKGEHIDVDSWYDFSVCPYRLMMDVTGLCAIIGTTIYAITEIHSDERA